MRNLLFILFVMVITACSTGLQEEQVVGEEDHSPSEKAVFRSLASSTSGIHFTNTINENDNLNFFTYEYLYNGGGVSVGDINNDGLSDLFFIGNMAENKIYLNRGGLQFEDVSSVINLNAGNDWCTGSTMVDINQDGNLDIYICRSGWFEDASLRENLLYINNGDGTFSEEAKKYGIADSGYSVHSSFFDFDRDGDLDLFVTNHPNEFSEELSDFKAKHQNPPNACRDKLYRNDGGQFKDISFAAGIKTYGHSLGLITTDLNNDGWMDIYVSNDYQEPDYFFKNNGDGTFSDISQKAMKHVAKFSMGVDANDINNDGLVDVFTVEMLAEDRKRQKTNMAPMNPKLFWRFVKEGFGYQFMHNCLQLNNGNETFSEIAYLSNVATTDWSWAPLIADFDNDGLKDIFISNGYKRDLLDKDFQKKKKSILTESGGVKFSELVQHIPSTKIPNYIFRNKGTLEFEDKSKDWGIASPSFSNGAVYADLDNDGDLEIVVNNINQEAFVYENTTNTTNNFLKIKLIGAPVNRQAIGSKVAIRYGETEQVNELTLSRGYQSSVEPMLHFGVGKTSQITEVKITWPDGKVQRLENVAANQQLVVNHADAEKENNTNTSKQQLFAAVSNNLGIAFKHQETPFDDYAREVLLPHKASQNGGTVVSGDVNGDGMEDLVFGAAANYPTQLYLQKSNGEFEQKIISDFQKDKAYEDMDALLFDADQDGDQDLYLVSGSSEFYEGSDLYIDRFYINDGAGNFTKAMNDIPSLKTSGSCVTGADFDQDGDIDLFVGGRIVPGKYLAAPDSYLLKNEGGKFIEATEELAPELKKIGMTTAALWTDIDQDNDADLIVLGEWMPVSVFVNDNGKFQNATVQLGLEKTTGWWNSIAGGDFDQDGDMDYLLGNLGTNSKNTASLKSPFVIYADDFDGNGNNDVVLAKVEDNHRYPARGLQCSSEQLPMIKDKIQSYQLFAESTLEEVYGKEKLAKALTYEAYEFRSSLLLNEGGKSFSLSPLPNETQVGPTNSILIQDFNEDGCMDAILVGNQYPVEVETGRYDAHKGVLLTGSCKGAFAVMPLKESGFFIDGDAKSIASVFLKGKNRNGLIVGINNGRPLIFEPTSPRKTSSIEQNNNSSSLTGLDLELIENKNQGGG